MSVIDRTIAFARTDDGRTVSQFAHRVRLLDGEATVGAGDVDPGDFATVACDAWDHWREVAAADPTRRLVAEAGIVIDGSPRHYTVVRLDGAILQIDGRQYRRGTASDACDWTGRPEVPAVMLAPSAVLALTDFALDGLPGGADAQSWPFDDTFVVTDTSHSPYPPQHRDGGPAQPLGPATRNGELSRPGEFLLLQRSERWQRPMNALYNISRRNLAITHAPRVSPPENAIILETLTAECEPTLEASTWLASWYAVSPDGCRSGRGRLAVTCRPQQVIGASLGAVSAAQPACVCDPIEGEIFATAPTLLIDIARSGMLVEPVAS